MEPIRHAPELRAGWHDDKEQPAAIGELDSLSAGLAPRMCVSACGIAGADQIPARMPEISLAPNARRYPQANNLGQLSSECSFVFRRLRTILDDCEAKDGVPEGIRTPDLRFRKPLLYPAELPGHRASSSMISARRKRGKTMEGARTVCIVPVPDRARPRSCMCRLRLLHLPMPVICRTGEALLRSLSRPPCPPHMSNSG
jgi:hypothetical protein